jgi:Kef-type K+ transport system membrane component KefB
MSVEVILMVLSGLVICSYLFDLVAKKIRVPSVILLLVSGIGLSYLATFLGIRRVNFAPILPVIGTVGLILIVLEGSLELKLHREKSSMIKQSLASAFFILLFTTLGIAFFFHYLTGDEFQRCFLNAVPLGIISSAIAIPSANALSPAQKEFIVYESSFSDIFGIILFNFMVSNETITAYSFVELGWSTIIILLLAALFCLLLLYLLKRITHNLKFFLIIAVLILAYSVGKYYHLPTLIMVLVFGLFLNNLHWIRFRWFTQNFKYDNFYKDFHQLAQLSGESAFIVRTFFFLIFGFTLDVDALLSMTVVRNGALVLAIIYFIRILYMRIGVPKASWAEYLLSPRGLISILLFFSIPESQKLTGLGNGLLFFIILGSSLVMTIGLLSAKKEQPVEGSGMQG